MQVPATTLKQNEPTEEQIADVISAVALGWSLIELLGRCFTIILPTPEKIAADKMWTGEKMIIISPTITSQKSLMSLIYFIQSLIKKLQLTDNENNTCILCDLVQKLCDLASDKDPMVARFRGNINCHLFQWDLQIRENLQKNSTQLRNTYDLVNAYMVGKSFAALRWYDEKAQGQVLGEQKDVFNARYFATLRDRVQLMAPYLFKFAPLALANSLEGWKNPISSREICPEESEELHKQADIWYELLTAERDPITYVTPSSVSWRYSLRVVRFSLPFVVLGIVLVLVLTALFFILIGFLWAPIVSVLNVNQIVSSTAAVFKTGISLLAGIGVALPTVKSLWQLVIQKGQKEVNQGAGKALTDVFWEVAQQVVINNATTVDYQPNVSSPENILQKLNKMYEKYLKSHLPGYS